MPDSRQLNPAHGAALIRVGEDNTKTIHLRFIGDQSVRFVGSFNRKTMGNEGTKVDSPGGQKLHHRLEVASLRPSHITDRIVVPFFFVPCVVSSRSIRAGHTKIELLHVIRLARQLHADGANCHYARTITRNLRSQRHRIVTLGRSGDQYRVRALAGAKSSGRPFHSVGRGCRGSTAQLLSKLTSAPRGIHADDDAAAGPRELYRHLSDGPEADDRDHLADLQLGETSAMKRNGSNRTKCCLVEGNFTQPWS